MGVRRPLAAVLAAVLGFALSLIPLTVAASPAHAAPSGDRDVIVHLFQWRWESVAEECESTLGPNGFGAVQVSPPQEHVVLSGQGYPWWQDYQPVSYRLDQTRRGTRADFVDMVDRCRDAGVKIYVDAIINHMSGTGSIGAGPGSAGSSYSKYDYPGIYQSQHFGDCRRDIANWNDKWEVQNCELVGLSDLDTSSDHVRDRVAAYLNDLVGIGVAGFRLDAAKHVPEADVQAIVSRLDDVHADWGGGKPYVFQEVIADGTIGTGSYTPMGDVTEFQYHRDISHAFDDGNIAHLSGLGGGLTPGDKAVVFVANHDTQRSDPILTHTDGARYDLAQSFMLAHPYGTPKVMSSYTWSGSTDTGPPMSADGTTDPTDCSASRWVCEHRAVAGMVSFRNAVDGHGIGGTVTDGDGRLAFARGSAGYAAFNATGSAWTRTFSTDLPDGTYCDVANGTFVDGVCDAPSYEVSDGRFTASVPANGAVALHVGALGECEDPDGCSSEPPPPGGECSVIDSRFDATVTTWYGQEVHVVGSIPELGSWNPADGLKLNTDGSTYPVWKGQVSLPEGTRFDYKYVKINPDGTVEWENGDNRSAVADDSGGCSRTFTGSWR
ncbi:alpha amylase C-terminal domain-containing protein [Thermobifida halotolerans]|uniref:Alpha-amylase n=1 Tax=Thermobifida halotolerans TaxID=483545 RepID=A0A399G5J3_9ACTN|nr:carbohydrate-binding module family 20 domain-containing protein [Thermobifida halotolerans]UOE20102.1 alpha amylase C-terminal domain-containing protein [Thermobifida halotolerans]